jgi:hypothetical protein
MTFHLVRISDIERNGYCFTDGCGRVSPDLFEAMTARYAELVTPTSCRIPEHCSTCQMRVLGYKGIVMVDPALGNASNKLGFEYIYPTWHTAVWSSGFGYAVQQAKRIFRHAWGARSSPGAMQSSAATSNIKNACFGANCADSDGRGGGIFCGSNPLI